MLTEGKPHRGWSDILAELKESNLSCQAQIILLYLCSKFRATSFSIEDILSAFRLERHKVDDVIDELKKAGYMYQALGDGSDSQRYTVYLSPHDNIGQHKCQSHK